MPLKWKGIEFTENAPTSPKEAFSPNGARATREFIVVWEDRFALVEALVGFPLASPDGVINRAVPHHYHPNNVERPFLHCVRVAEIEPWGKPTAAVTADAPVPTYTHAKLTAEYETLPYSVLKDDEVKASQNTQYGPWPSFHNESLRFCEITFKPAGEYLTLPHGYYLWASDKTQSPQPLRASEHHTDIVCIWHQVPSIPPAALSMVGTVNSQPMYFVVGGKVMLHAAVDTLALISVEPTPYVSAQADRLWQITYRWQYRPQGHQKFRRYIPNAHGPGEHDYPYELLSLNGSATYRAAHPNFIAVRADHRYLFVLYPPP